VILEIVCFRRGDNASSRQSRILFVYPTTITLLSPARFGVEFFLADTLIGCRISIAIEKARQVHNRTRTRESSNGMEYESKYRLKFNSC